MRTDETKQQTKTKREEKKEGKKARSRNVKQAREPRSIPVQLAGVVRSWRGDLGISTEATLCGEGTLVEDVVPIDRAECRR